MYPTTDLSPRYVVPPEFTRDLCMGGLQQQAPLVKFGKYTGNIKPEKVADMGFLFRSYTTDAAIAEKPEIVDAVNLTGIVVNMTWH